MADQKCESKRNITTLQLIFVASRFFEDVEVILSGLSVFRNDDLEKFIAALAVEIHSFLGGDFRVQ